MRVWFSLCTQINEIVVVTRCCCCCCTCTLRYSFGFSLVIVLYLLFWPLINSLRHRRQPEKCRKGSTFVACCTCSNESCPNSARLSSSLIEQLVKWPLTVNVLSIGFPTYVFPSLHKSIIFLECNFHMAEQFVSARSSHDTYVIFRWDPSVTMTIDHQ